MPELPSSNPQDVQPRRPRGLLPPALVDLLVPALKVGTVAGKRVSINKTTALCLDISNNVAGGTGAISGLAAGIVRDVHPVLFGIASGVQWFTLGSSFWR